MRKLKLQELGRPDVETYKAEKKLSVVLVLDDIRSALNVGSLFRTSDAMGIEAVYLCGITATPPSREIHKTAIGATESVEWVYFDNVESALIKLRQKGYNVVTVEQTDASVMLGEYRPTEAEAIVLGNEVHGVSDTALGLSNTAIEVPMYGTKHSLNVAVCGGIVLHHIASAMRSMS